MADFTDVDDAGRTGEDTQQTAYLQPDKLQLLHIDKWDDENIYNEIACSQNPKKLDKAAWQYIAYSNGNIIARNVTSYLPCLAKALSHTVCMYSTNIRKQGDDL